MKKLLLLVFVVMVLLVGCSKKEDVYYSDDFVNTVYYVHGMSDYHYPGDEMYIYVFEYDGEKEFPQTTLKKFGREKHEFHSDARVHLYFYKNSVPNSTAYDELGKKSELSKEEMRKFIDVINSEDRFKYSQFFEPDGRESFKENRD